MRSTGRRRGIAAAFAVLVFAGDVYPQDLPDVLDIVRPSIVAVGTFKQTDSPAFRFRGTGFVVSDGNLVATNAHVVSELPDPASGAFFAVLVKSAGKTEVRGARILATAADVDLALLRIDGESLPKLTLADSGSVREGLAIAFTGFPIGNVLGFSPVTHRGIVSAITPIALPGGTARQLNEKLIRRLRSGSFDVFQLDATAYPGNSGSPVFDARSGSVIGVINMVLVRGTKESVLTQPSGITYAVPANFLQELIRSVR